MRVFYQGHFVLDCIQFQFKRYFRKFVIAYNLLYFIDHGGTPQLIHYRVVTQSKSSRENRRDRTKQSFVRRGS